MSKGSSSPFGRASAKGGSVEVFVRARRSLFVRLLGLGWRLRAEIVGALLGLWLWRRATALMPGWLVLLVLVVGFAGVLGWAPTRRIVAGHFWCTVSRHRIRACLVQCRVMNHHGHVPWFVWVRPTNVGERAWLLCRPGISIRELEDKTTQLAAACWARDARVAASRRLAALIAVDVIRRDPLTSGHAVDNPLTAGLDNTVTPAAVDADRRRPLLTAVPDPASGQPTRPVVRPVEPVTFATSGEDVSDYV